MVKKIFDIIPPDKIDISEKKPEILPAEVLPEMKEKLEPKKVVRNRPVDDIKPVPSQRDFPSKKILLWLISFTLLVGGIALAYFFLPVVKIDVWLKTETLTAKEKIEISEAQKTVDPLTRVLPGRVIAEEQTLSQEFLATGKAFKEMKAEGVVTIFNDYSTASQSLMATTRFVSSDGKLFRLVERAVVPGQATEKGKLVPGTVEAKVRADASGPDYNIGPSTFSIPGFAGTPKYTAFHAKSSSAMKGGFKGETAVVSAEDLNKAKEAVRSRLGAKIDSILQSKAVAGLVLAKESVPLIVADEGSMAKAGDPVKTFSYQVKARTRAVLLAQEDLDELAQNYLFSKLAADQKSLPETIKILPLVQTIDEKSGKAALNLEVSGKVYLELKEEFLREQLKEKSIQEVEKTFQNLTQVARAKIKISPSFVKRLPKDSGKIEIMINFD
ncbi:MAG: hypothetical protein Q8N16_01685 [bacterium]|nr:hypothetical protein [bacterium]